MIDRKVKDALKYFRWHIVQTKKYTETHSFNVGGPDFVYAEFSGEDLSLVCHVILLCAT